MKNILMLFLLSFQMMQSQEKTITGMVTDENGGWLPGANVTVKSTTHGTQTDLDGKYSLKATKGEVLVFSFVGYRVLEFVVGDSDVINAKLIYEPGLETAYGYNSPVLRRQAIQPKATIIKAGDIAGCAEPLASEPRTIKMEDKNPTAMFADDLKANSLKLYIIGGFAATVHPEDAGFQKDFAVKFHDFGCVVPQDAKVYIAYNKLVFSYLEKQFSGWQNKIRKDVLGLAAWQKKQ